MRRRQGFVIGLVVFAALTFLALAIAPTLNFGGAQVSSEKVSLSRWYAYSKARAGLEIAAHRLAKKRWWGGANPGQTRNQVISSGANLGTFQSSDPDLGFDASEGTFQVVAEAVVGRPIRIGSDLIQTLHHIDVFSKGEFEGKTVVMYGAYVLYPSPYFHGSEYELPPDSGPLLKRMFRRTLIRDEAMQDIQAASARDAIRDRIAVDGEHFLDNYRKVDFHKEVSEGFVDDHCGGTGCDDPQADAFLEKFLATYPPTYDEEAVFLRDRVYDILFEGTKPGDRPKAVEERKYEVHIDPCSPGIDLVKYFFSISGKAWVPAACETPDKWNKSSTKDLHDGVTPVEGYIDQVAFAGPIFRDYDFGCSEAVSPTATPGEIPAGAVQLTMGEGAGWWCVPYANVSDPYGHLPLVTKDSYASYDGMVFNQIEFTRKALNLEEGLACPDEGVSDFWEHFEPCVGDPGDPGSDGECTVHTDCPCEGELPVDGCGCGCHNSDDDPCSEDEDGDGNCTCKGETKDGDCGCTCHEDGDDCTETGGCTCRGSGPAGGCTCGCHKGSGPCTTRTHCECWSEPPTSTCSCECHHSDDDDGGGGGSDDDGGGGGDDGDCGSTCDDDSGGGSTPPTPPSPPGSCSGCYGGGFSG